MTENVERARESLTKNKIEADHETTFFPDLTTGREYTEEERAIIDKAIQIKSATHNAGSFLESQDDIRFRIVNNDFLSFATKYDLEETDVKQYADSIRMRNLGGASYAFQNMKRKVRIDNTHDTFQEFSKRFSPIRKELYETFGNIDELREEVISNTKAEQNIMEAARKRAEKEAEVENMRLQEFRDMSDRQLDDEYFGAIDKNDETRTRDLVNEAARRKGYEDIDSDYQGAGAWAAPSNPGYESDRARRADFETNSPDINIEDIAKGYSPQPDDYFENLRAYGMNTPEGRESAAAINGVINTIRTTGHTPEIKVFRAVPTDVKENNIRNADWVTPSKKYAQMHGENRLEGNYRLIEQEIRANDLWWDGNDINEWGFDDGKEYRYTNTHNNRKLNSLITYNDHGNIIPLSQRFDSHNDDVRFRFIGEKGAANLDRAEEATIRTENLTIARKMETSGKEPEAIKLATGWERGADGKWRYEVMDFDIDIQGNQGNKIANNELIKELEQLSDKILSEETLSEEESKRFDELSDRLDYEKKLTTDRIEDGEGVLQDYIIDNNGLFDAYPQLKGVKVEFVNEQGNTGGTYNSETNTIKVNISSSLEAKEVLIHEVQHAIQEIERFAVGGNLQSLQTEQSKAKVWAWRNELIETKKENSTATSLDVEKILEKEYAEAGMKIPSQEDMNTGFNLFVRGYDNEGYEQAFNNVAKSLGDVIDREKEFYKRIAGEVEARNVQSRMNMTPEERRNSLAKLTEDVKREDQVFLKNSFSGSVYPPKVEFIPAIESLSNSLHVPINIINDINELPDSVAKRKIEAGHNIKGWFLPTTESVAIYLPNITDPQDAQRTIFHEVVAHYGLRKMFGEHFDNFLDNVYNNASIEIQSKILYSTLGDPSKRAVGTEEYLAQLAEHGFDNPEEKLFWNKIKDFFIDMLRKAGVKLGFKLTDDSLRYILYQSYRNLILIPEVPSNNLKSFNMDKKMNEKAQETRAVAIPGEIRGVVLTEQQKNQLTKGEQVFLENLIDRNGKPFSANVSYDFEKNKPVYNFPEKREQEQEFRMPNTVKGIELSKENKQKLTQGEKVFIEGMTSAKGTLFDAYVYIDQEKKTLAFDFPEKREQEQEFRMPHTVKGIELSEENKQKLTQGEKVFIEGMRSAKGTLFDAYVYIDREKKTLAFDFPEKEKKGQEQQPIRRKEPERRNGIKM